MVEVIEPHTQKQDRSQHKINCQKLEQVNQGIIITAKQLNKIKVSQGNHD